MKYPRAKSISIVKIFAVGLLVHHQNNWIRCVYAAVSYTCAQYRDVFFVVFSWECQQKRRFHYWLNIFHLNGGVHLLKPFDSTKSILVVEAIILSVTHNICLPINQPTPTIPFCLSASCSRSIYCRIRFLQKYLIAYLFLFQFNSIRTAAPKTTHINITGRKKK